MFRDFNVAKDREAAASVLATGVPLVLVPYEAARGTEIDAATLERMAAAGPASRWVAERARAWLGYWNDEVGRRGFYPFDLLAAAFAIEPQRFACADVAAEVGRDETLFFPFSRRPALLVRPREPGAVTSPPPVLYCHGVRMGAEGLEGELGGSR